jgi:hypothetical protein
MIVIKGEAPPRRTIRIERLDFEYWQRNWRVYFPTLDGDVYSDAVTIREILELIKTKMKANPYMMGYLLNIKDLDEEETLQVNLFNDVDMVEVILRYTL